MCVMAGLGDYPAAAVLRAEDIARAKKFYADVVGLKPRTSPALRARACMFTAGDGTMVMIY